MDAGPGGWRVPEISIRCFSRGCCWCPPVPAGQGCVPRGTLTWGAWGRRPHCQLVLVQWQQQRAWCYQVWGHGCGCTQGDGLSFQPSSARWLWRITGAKVTLRVSSGLLGLTEKLLPSPRDFLNPTFPGCVSRESQEQAMGRAGSRGEPASCLCASAALCEAWRGQY